MRNHAEANLTALIESTDDLIWSVDLDFRLIAFNRALRESFEKDFGFTIELGKDPLGSLPAERVKDWRSFYQRALGEGTFRVEYALKDGRMLEMAFNLIVEEGETTGISVFGKDISARKAAESSLQFLASMVACSEDALVATSPSGELLTWNHGAEVIFGYTDEEALGKPLSMLVAPERLDEVAGLTRRVLEGESIPLTHGIGRRKDGTKTYLTVTSWPVRDSAQKVTAISILMRDVSEHQAAEEAQALLASIVESSSDAVHAVQLDGTIASWNHGAEKMCGYAREEVLGTPIALLVSEASMAEVSIHLKAVEDGRPMGSFDSILKHKDGHCFDVSLLISPIRGRDGRIISASVIARDITGSKQSEKQLRDSEERYRATFEQAAVGIVHAAMDGQIQLSNTRFAEFLGYSVEEVCKLTTQEISCPEDRAASTEMQRQLASGEVSAIHVEKQYICKNGNLTWARVTISMQRDSEGRALHYIAVVEDINALRAAEARLAVAQSAQQGSEERYRSAFQTSLDAININRLSDGVYIETNKAFLEGMGYLREEVVGHTSLDLSVWADPRDRVNLLEMLSAYGSCRDIEARFRKKNGQIFWARLSASIIEIEGESCILSVARDVSEAKFAEEEIKNLAFYDPLTGLPNRRLLLERLRQALIAGARKSAMTALLFVDLDDFKTLNDTLGHQTGDLLLRQVGLRITGCVSEADTVGRLGGDEFVVMLEDLSEVAEDAASQAKDVGEKILEALRQPYQINGRECLSTSSIGITVFGEQRESTNEVLQQADIAMYQAKAAGRNTISFFAPALQAAVHARVALEDDLRQAIKNHQFQLYYQPQVDSTRLVGAEALLRWNHPVRGLLLPGEFIHTAEDTGLILPLGDWVLETACRQIAAWSRHAYSSNVTVAVNISARQLREANFVPSVLKTLDLTGADPRLLKLELTESMLVDNIEEVIAKMAELKTHGLRFSLDDFGTGYSSLSYLKRLPLDQLKIDRAFVRDILVDASSGAIAQTILSLSRAMGLSVLAEGVETAEQRNFLACLGCHSYQGYLFSKAVPVEQFEELLRSNCNTPELTLH